MPIQTAGQRTAKSTKLRIENLSTITLPKGAIDQVQKVIDYLPIEHIRGLEKVKLVDFINFTPLKNVELPIKCDLTGLYHTKKGKQKHKSKPT